MWTAAWRKFASWRQPAPIWCAWRCRAKNDTEALKDILPQVNVPIVADVHFHFGRALEAIEAGVHKIRLNPGNISDRKQVEEVIAACKEKGLPIRIGVNEGSIIERKGQAEAHEGTGRGVLG